VKTIATHESPAWIPPATVFWTEPTGERRSQADISVEAAEVLAQRARDAGRTEVEVVLGKRWQTKRPTAGK